MAGIATIAASLELCGWSPAADWPLACIYNWRSYALTAPESHESRPWIWKLLACALEACQLGECSVTQRHSHIDIDASKHRPKGAKGSTNMTGLLGASWNIAMVENV